jgi:hypothetical protein
MLLYKELLFHYQNNLAIQHKLYVIQNSYFIKGTF